MRVNKDLAIINLLREVGTPYIWGGSSFKTGVDCSGFTQLKLADYGLDPSGDQTAQGLYNHFSKLTKVRRVKVSDVVLWDLLFFGKNVLSITHVAIGLGYGLMVEAGGGSSTTTTKAEAERIGAKVRVSNILRRSDLVAAIPVNGIILED